MGKRSSPATVDAAYHQNSSVTVLTIVATGAMRIPVTTAPLGLSPAGQPRPACPETSSVMGGPIAKMDKMKPRACAVQSRPLLRSPQLVQPQSFSVEMERASGMRGGVTTPRTALTTVMRKTVVSESSRCTLHRSLQIIHFVELILFLTF